MSHQQQDSLSQTHLNVPHPLNFGHVRESPQLGHTESYGHKEEDPQLYLNSMSDLWSGSIAWFYFYVPQTTKTIWSKGHRCVLPKITNTDLFTLKVSMMIHCIS